MADQRTKGSGRKGPNLLRGKASPWWQTWGVAIVLSLIALGVTWHYLPEPVPDRIRLATGSEEGGYHAFGERMAEELRRDGFDVEVVTSSGSIDNLRMLAEGGVDLALVQGGTVPEKDRGLRSLCAVFFEPLWLFRARDFRVERLRDLEGHRVAIGEEGSGTRPLVVRLLEANGVEPGRIDTVPLGGEEGAKALLDGEVEAVFFVVSPEATYLEPLLAAGERIVLHDWARHESYARRWPFLNALTLSEGLLDLERNIPPERVRVVAPAASIVMHGGTHRGLVMPVIEAATRLQRRGGPLAEPGTFPTQRYVDAPMDEDAARYFEEGPSFLYRVFPYPIARVLDRLKIFLIPLLTLLLPLFRVAPPVYRWRMRARIYRWYRILRETDDVLRTPGTDADRGGEDLRGEIERLDALEREITEVEVPLSFTDELYHLHMHIDYVRRKIARRMEEDGGDAARGEEATGEDEGEDEDEEDDPGDGKEDDGA